MAWSSRARSAVDASMLTGESVPVEVEPGDDVVGATVNADGRLVVRANRIGSDTALAQMARLVEDAQNGKAHGPAVGRPDLRRLRADRHRVVRGDAGILDRHGRTGRGGVHRRGGGADHRVSLRAGPRDADGVDGRYGPGCAAGHPDQGSGGAGIDAAGRHHRVGQDGHRDHRHDDAARCDHRGRRTTRTRCCGSQVRSRTRPSIRSRRRSRRARGDKVGELPAAEDFTNLRGLGVRGCRRGPRRGGRAAAAVRARCPDELAESVRRAESEGRTAVAVGWDGKARGVLVVADAVKPTSADAVKELRALGLDADHGDRRQRGRRPHGRRDRSESTR